MAAEDMLNTQQFAGRGWTPTQVTNMAKLARINAAVGARNKNTDHQRFGRISDITPVKSPSNW